MYILYIIIIATSNYIKMVVLFAPLSPLIWLPPRDPSGDPLRELRLTPRECEDVRREWCRRELVERPRTTKTPPSWGDSERARGLTCNV